MTASKKKKLKKQQKARKQIVKLNKKVSEGNISPIQKKKLMKLKKQIVAPLIKTERIKNRVIYSVRERLKEPMKNKIDINNYNGGFWIPEPKIPINREPATPVRERPVWDIVDDIIGDGLEEEYEWEDPDSGLGEGLNEDNIPDWLKWALLQSPEKGIKAARLVGVREQLVIDFLNDNIWKLDFGD